MRRATIIVAAAGLSLALAAPALAGGWAVTTFENLPESFEAGTTYTLDYTIRQHGKTPVDSGASHVMLRNFDQLLRFDAANHGDGTYSVEVTVPSDGSWEWEVVSEGWGSQPLGTIEVAAPVVAPAGFELLDAFKVILPLATLIAAAFTLREWARARSETPSPQTG
ncbi:MAG: hypothetical protein ACRDVL_07155 [Acidimicrobiia bacterium]